MRANGLKHETTTTGTGALTLTGVSGWPGYDDVFGTSGTRLVDYTILDSAGVPIEGGVGAVDLATMVLTRTLPYFTWTGSVYDDTSPAALGLASGTKGVICAALSQTGGIFGLLSSIGDNLGLTASLPMAGTFNYGFTHQRLEMSWCPLRKATQISQVSMRLNGAYSGGTSSLRVGLYEINTSGLPQALLADFGNLGSLSAGVLTSSALGTPVTLPPSDMYALGVLAQFTGGTGTPTVSTTNATMGGSPFGSSLLNGVPSNRTVMMIGSAGQTALPTDASGLTYTVTNSNTAMVAVVK